MGSLAGALVIGTFFSHSDLGISHFPSGSSLELFSMANAVFIMRAL
jgi:hypothetical protein